MKNAVKTLCFITILITLCSCTKSAETDVYEFVSRLNTQLGEKAVAPDSYYKLENDYFFFISPDFLLTLSANENLTAEKCELTLTKNESPLNSDEVFSFYTVMCAVLCNKEVSEITAVFEKNGLSAKSVDFIDSTFVFTWENFDFFVYSNSQSITLLCEINC